MNVLLFAGLTLRELVRRRLVAAVALLTVAIVGFTAWGLHRLATAVVDGAPIAEPGVRAAAAGIVIMLAFLFSFVIALGAALVAAPAMAESIANGEILAVLARPVRRAEIALGRWLGTVVAIALYVAVAGGLELLVVRAITGYVPPHPLHALAYLAGAGAVVTTAAIALAARLPALAAGIVAALHVRACVDRRDRRIDRACARERAARGRRHDRRADLSVGCAVARRALRAAACDLHRGRGERERERNGGEPVLRDVAAAADAARVGVRMDRRRARSRHRGVPHARLVSVIGRAPPTAPGV